MRLAGGLCGLIELLVSGGGRLRRELVNLLADWLAVYEMVIQFQDEPHR